MSSFTLQEERADPACPPTLCVSAFTGGRNMPSARFRVRQHIPHLRDLEILVREYPLAGGWNPPADKLRWPPWMAGVVADRLWGIYRSYSADLTLIQKHLLPGVVPAERYMKRPLVLDVDDAIWLRKFGAGRIRRLAALSDGVICGNSYLAGFFSKYSPAIQIVPTAVDTGYFSRAAKPPSETVIGWTGTSVNLGYLVGIETALAAALKKLPGSRVRVVCDQPPRFTRIPESRLEFIPWTRNGEVAAIQGMTMGLMPLDDSEWARGKCSFKMLCYMSCGIPVVVSPVGMNAEVLRLSGCGHAARTTGEWTDAMLDIATQPGRAAEMGNNGRETAVLRFSLKVIGNELARALRSYF